MQDWVACVFGIHLTCSSLLDHIQRKIKKRGCVVYLEWKGSGGRENGCEFDDRSN